MYNALFSKIINGSARVYMKNFLPKVTGLPLYLGLVVAAGFVVVPSLTHACGPFDFKVSKSGPSQAHPGDIITYNIVVEDLNRALNSVAQSITLTDQFSQGLVFRPDLTKFIPTPGRYPTAEEYTRDGWTFGIDFMPNCQQTTATTIQCRLPFVGNNPDNGTWYVETTTIQLAFQVPPQLACTTITNQVAGTVSEGTRGEIDINPANNQSGLVQTVITGCPSPTPTPTPTPTPEIKKDLNVAKTDHRDITRPGHSLTYVVTVHNGGNVDLHDLTITDKVPSQLTVTTIHDGGQLSGTTITWHNLTLGDGETKTVSFIARVKDNTPNQHVLVNQVTAESKDHGLKDEDTDNTIVQRLPAIAAAKVPSPVVPIPVTAKTGAGMIGLLSTLMGGAGLAFINRRSF